ncbi:YmiA family putative membrane protein [Candidatus Pantoea persica]|nr:YmiA family putative membrane protein [Candidatus Pantoea persica]
MATRLTVQPGFRAKSTKVKCSASIRRKAWLTVFTASVLF